MPWYEIVGLVLLGFVVGGYGSMVGVGGGFILTPIFLLAHIAPKDAAGTSLAVVLANAASGTWSYFRQKRIDMYTALVFAAAGIPGAILGALIDQYIPHRTFAVMYALLCTVVGARLLITADPRRRPVDGKKAASGAERAPARGTIVRNLVDAEGVRYTYRYNLGWGIALSFGVGFLASIFGIGGGVVHVPAMVYLFSFPAHIAIATSTVIIALTSLFGTASHAYYGDVLYAPAIVVSVGAVLGAQAGAKLARTIKPAPLLRLLSIALLTAAVTLIYRAL